MANDQDIENQLLTAFDLANPKTLDLFNFYINRLITYDLINEVPPFVKGLRFLLDQNKNLAKNKADYYQQYEKILVLAQFVALSFYPEKTIIELIENNLADALAKEDLIVADKIKAKLVAIFDPPDRDTFKREIREAILRNNQHLTANDIIFEDKRVEPTISSWVKDYNRVVGAEVANPINRLDYLTNNQNTKNLSPEDRKKVENLLNLYEYLKISSNSVEGVEEAIPYYINGQHYVLTGGRFEPVKEDKYLKSVIENKPLEAVEQEIASEEKEEIPTSVSELELEDAEPQKVTVQPAIEKEVLAAYQGDQKQNQAVAKEEAKISKSFGADLMKIRQEFFLAVQNKNINRTIAVLNILAKQNDLENFVKTDAKLSQFLAAIWEKRYGPEFANEFKQKPIQLKFIRLFLRYVLEERLELPVSSAARVGLQLGNIFVSLGKKDYNKMAYFDVGNKNFEWFE